MITRERRARERQLAEERERSAQLLAQERARSEAEKQQLLSIIERLSGRQNGGGEQSS